MKIKSKYDGKCVGCGRKINAGEEIEWDKQTKYAYHLACAAKATEPAPYKLSGGSGYGCYGWSANAVIKFPEMYSYTPDDQYHPEFLFVVRSSKEYWSADGLSFGVGDDRGYIYYADCREATPEEAEPLRKEIEKEKRKNTFRIRLHEIEKLIRKHENYFSTGEKIHLDGDKYFDTSTIYGGGSYFLINDDSIWFVKNNGGDGDNWSMNNICTGAIGWRIERDENLVSELEGIKKELESEPIL